MSELNLVLCWIAIMSAGRTAKKDMMMISAIYPIFFAIALYEVWQWLYVTGADHAVMHNFAVSFAGAIPAPQESYDDCVRDAERVDFDDHDPGWPDMELPPRVNVKDRRVALKKRKLMREAQGGPIDVDETDEEGEEADAGEHSDDPNATQEYRSDLRAARATLNKLQGAELCSSCPRCGLSFSSSRITCAL